MNVCPLSKQELEQLVLFLRAHLPSSGSSVTSVLLDWPSPMTSEEVKIETSPAFVNKDICLCWRMACDRDRVKSECTDACFLQKWFCTVKSKAVTCKCSVKRAILYLFNNKNEFCWYKVMNLCWFSFAAALQILNKPVNLDVTVLFSV